MPGDRVPTQRSLIDTYNVGISSVREALRLLESTGLITREGKGSFVVAARLNPLNSSFPLLMSLNRSTLRDLYEVRRMFETEIAALAALRREEADLAAMRAEIDAFASAMEEDDLIDALEADLRFHMALAVACHNPLAAGMIEAIREPLHQAFEAVMDVPDGPRHAIHHHRVVLAAVQAGNPEEARRAMRDHLETVEREAGDLLDRSASNSWRRKAARS